MSAEGPQLGEDVVVAGYPFSDSLSGSVKVTRGIVSSLSGPGNNSSIIQIDAAVQPGSSGGPIFNERAQVIGIVIAKASAEYFLTTTGALPENVNFGITVGTASAFLKGANVTFTRGEESAPPITVQEVAQEAQRYTIQLYCLK
jgi:S1-C subfamily serine protease